MTLTTYAGLQAAMAALLNRNDLTAAMPTFISLAEAEMRRDLLLRGALVQATATITTEGDTLPGDLEQLVNIRVNSTGYGPMTRIEPHAFDDMRASASTGTPAFYTTVGYEVLFYPAPPTTGIEILITFYETIPALSDSNTDNFLLLSSPDLYLYGSLKHTAPYLRDDERIALWDSLYQKGKEAALIANERAEFGATPLTIRTPRVIGASRARSGLITT